MRLTLQEQTAEMSAEFPSVRPIRSISRDDMLTAVITLARPLWPPHDSSGCCIAGGRMDDPEVGLHGRPQVRPDDRLQPNFIDQRQTSTTRYML